MKRRRTPTTSLLIVALLILQSVFSLHAPAQGVLVSEITFHPQAGSPQPSPNGESKSRRSYRGDVQADSFAPMSTFTVTNTNDSGPGSLREAINNANANPGGDEITFNIPGAGPHTITPASPLPEITGEVIIRGETQPGYFGTPVVGLDGSNAGADANGLVFKAATFSGVRGLVINRFSGNGILIEGLTVFNQFVKIENNYIGTDFSGTSPLPNGKNGVEIRNSLKSSVSQNVISANGRNGVDVIDGDSNVIGNNLIGTDKDGEEAPGMGNGTNGVSIRGTSKNNVVGGAADMGNTISGNGKKGVFVGPNALDNQVEGNKIGTNSTGTKRTPNGEGGVSIEDSPGNTIGGTEPGTGNVISGNQGNGVEIIGPASTGNKVQGNMIGTDSTGKQKLGNSGEGVRVLNAPNNTIGGAGAGAGNIIGGNGDGMSVINSPNTWVMGNHIGANLLGHDLGNLGAGVGVAGNSSGTAIGGTDTGAGNVIANNGAAGLFNAAIAPWDAVGNAFKGDHRMTLVGPATNVTADVTSAVASASNTIIEGRVQGGAPLQDFKVQIYWRPKDDFYCKALGGFSLRANGVGTAAFRATFGSPLATGSQIAMFVSTDTPQVFSDHTQVTGDASRRAELELTKTGPETAKCGDEITYTITLRNKGDAAAIDPFVVDFASSACVENVFFTLSQGTYLGNFIVNGFSLGRIDPGGSATITATVKLKDDCGGDLKQSAAVFGDDNDPEDDDPDSSAEVMTKINCTKITDVMVDAKNLVVMGFGFEKGDMVEINGIPAKKTKMRSDTELFAKKGAKSLDKCDPADRDAVNRIEVLRAGLPVAVFGMNRCPPGAPSTTTLTSNPNPSREQDLVTFNVTVTGANGTPTGTVEFRDGTQAIHSSTLNGNGQASFSTPDLAAGSHSITAAYSGDMNFVPSTSAPLNQVVNPMAHATTTTLITMPNPSQFGQPIGLEATVVSGWGTPTGAVSFMDGNTLIGTGSLNSMGRAVATVPNLSAGTHSIRAVYGGNSVFAGSTSNVVTQVVNPASQ